MPKPKDQNCGLCTFTVKATNSQLVCVRYPPAVSFENRSAPGWPIVPADAWCGEFKKVTP